MKLVQILNGFCHWDATRLYSSISDIPPNTYAPDILFVEAPDFVFESWGYDQDAEGDARFIKPTPPEGWIYDDATGTFYPEGFTPTEPTDPLAEADMRILELEYENLLLREGLV